MQVAACPQVQFVSVEDILESILNKDKELDIQREDLSLKMTVFWRRTFVRFTLGGTVHNANEEVEA